MANKSVIVIKKAGELITKAYVERLVKEYTSYMGTAIVYENELVIDHQKGKPTVEAVMTLQDSFKDQQIVLVFGDNPALLPEDMQPFEVLVDKDSDTRVAVALEGNFEGYSVKGSSHTNEYHCKEDFLSKKLPKLFKAANAGLPGLVTELDDPITQQDFSNSWTDRGFITFLTTAGPSTSVFNKGHVFKADYNWGSTSNSLNYVEQTVSKDAPKSEEKPLTRLQQLQAKMKGVTGAVKAPEAPAPKDLPVETTRTADTVLLDKEFEIVTLPAIAKDWTNKEKMKWWIDNVGYKPDGFKDLRTKVKRTKGATGALSAVGNTKVEDAATPISAAEAATMKVDPKTLPDKKEAPEHAKDTSPKHVTMENMPILSPKQKLTVKNAWMKDAEVLKILDDTYQAVALDPKKLTELEDNYQTFMDGLGLPAKTWLSFDGLMSLGSVELKALAQFAFNAQNRAASSEMKLTSILANPANKIADRKLAM